jgi:penicillin-insensitive murein endopeptidase
MQRTSKPRPRTISLPQGTIKRMRTALTYVAVVAFALGRGSFHPGVAQSRHAGQGSLKNGVSLPARGDGFITYSALGNSLGRQYVHSRVRDTLLAAFAALYTAEPGRTFVLGETGLKSGGRFPPHKTHQNGLSVDIFMPVRDNRGRYAVMPTAFWNNFGYSLEFDAQGRGKGGLSIDFESVADLLVELDRQAERRGLAIDLIIVAPEYVDRILAVKNVPGLDRLSARFLRAPAWVRHDEHIHVDFRLAERSRHLRPAAS